MSVDDPGIQSANEGNAVLDAWLAFLKAVPGAGKAVAEIIGEFGHAGTAFMSIATAKGKQIAQGIENDAKMQAAVSEALTTAAVKHVEANKEGLGPRALEFGARRFIKQQVNREAVVIKALEYVRDDPPSEPPKEVPTDDWFNIFGKFAENASSEKMREHWSQILKGEIVRPGSFSFACLHLASILDQDLAASIEKIVPWVVKGEFVPVIGATNEGEIYSDLIKLDGIGFLRLTNSSYKFRYSPEGQMFIELWDKAIKLEGQPNAELAIPAAVLPPAGRELLSILPQSTAAGLVTLISDHARSLGAKNIAVLDVMRRN